MSGAQSDPAPLDLTHSALQPRDALALERLDAVRTAYLEHGRGREAHAVGRCLNVLWHTYINPPELT